MSAVLAQLPKQMALEVGSEEVASGRLDKVEQQVSDLHAQHVQLHPIVTQQAHDSSAQFQDMQAQLTKQGAHFEQAINSQASQLQAFQDTIQEQFCQQVHHQRRCWIACLPKKCRSLKVCWRSATSRSEAAQSWL